MHHYDNMTLIWKCLKSCIIQLFGQHIFHGSWSTLLALYDVVPCMVTGGFPIWMTSNVRSVSV